MTHICSMNVFHSGLALVSIVWVQPPSLPVPLAWLQCPGHCRLWIHNLLPIHSCNSDLHHQVNTKLIWHLCTVGLRINNITKIILSILNTSARFSKVLSNRSSFEGIWLLSIITYKYTSDTCFNILRCQKVSGEGITGEFVS